MNREDLDQLEARCNFSCGLWWTIVSGLTAIVYREKGERDLHKIWNSILSGEQTERYLEGLRKLGIGENEPPAVRAAKYHYLSNSIGGLNLHYIEETPKKVWLRYMGPNGTYPGIGMLATPAAQRRTVFSSWHAHNGELMGCPQLGYVATKFTAEGHPYDEGYFMEYNRDLKPEERIRFEVVRQTPEFDPAKAPKLDPVEWPRARILKAMRNFAGDYLRKTVEVLQNLYGEPYTNFIIQQTMRCLAVQFTGKFKQDLGIQGENAEAAARLFTGILGACFNDYALEKINEGNYHIILSTFKPFGEDTSEGFRAALFEFQPMAARMLSGRIRVTRKCKKMKGKPDPEIWEIEDKERWLW